MLCCAGAGGGAHLLEYDSDEVDRQYEVMTLHIVHRRRCTGFEESKDFPVRRNDVIAGRYRARVTPVSHHHRHSINVTSCHPMPAFDAGVPTTQVGSCETLEH